MTTKTARPEWAHIRSVLRGYFWRHPRPICHNYTYTRQATRSDGGRHGEGGQAGCQSPGAGRAGRPQPDARPRDGRAIPGGGVFRSPGPGAGEVRDGASGPHRGRDGDGGGAGVRRVAADLLPGPAGAGRRGPAGLGAQAAGAPGRPQADGRGDGVRRSGAPGRAHRGPAALSQRVRQRFGLAVHPRSIERARARREKKRRRPR